MLIYVASYYLPYTFHLSVWVPSCIHWPLIWLSLIHCFLKTKNISYISNLRQSIPTMFSYIILLLLPKKETFPPASNCSTLFLISRAGTSSSSVNTVPSDKAVGNMKDERGWYACTRFELQWAGWQHSSCSHVSLCGFLRSSLKSCLL